MVATQHYNVYKKNELIDEKMTKKGIISKYKFTENQVNANIYSFGQTNGYKIRNSKTKQDIDEPEDIIKSNTKSKNKVKEIENSETFIKNIKDGIIGNSERLKRLTKSKPIIETANNMVKLSYNCGYLQGKSDVYDYSEMSKENNELKIQVKELKEQIREMKILGG